MHTLWADHALTAKGWARNVAIDIDGGKIVQVRHDTPPCGYRSQVLLPAPTNLHSHAFQRAMAGLAEQRGEAAHDSFWTWRALMFRFLDRITPDDVRAITAFAQMEMAEAGFGACVEFHYLHHAPGGTPYTDLAELSAQIVAASHISGFGLTLAPVLYEYGSSDGRALTTGQIRFGNDPDRFAHLVEGAKEHLKALPSDARLAIAPHSLRAVTRTGINACVELARDGLPLHIHLAEQTAEVDEVEAVYGHRPVDVLFDWTDINPQWCLIHCTQTTEQEVRRLAASGAVVGLCPITESSLGDGIFDAVTFASHGGRFGIGTDSNIRLSLAEELRTLDYSQRLRDRVRAALATPQKSTGRVLFDAACQAGAQASGRDNGTIEAGKLADLVAIGGEHFTAHGFSGDLLLDSFVFTSDPRAVCDVWSAGRHIVQNGRHLQRHDISTGFAASMERLMEI